MYLEMKGICNANLNPIEARVKFSPPPGDYIVSKRAFLNEPKELAKKEGSVRQGTKTRARVATTISRSATSILWRLPAPPPHNSGINPSIHPFILRGICSLKSRS